jgi:hypothetical protein
VEVVEEEAAPAPGVEVVTHGADVLMIGIEVEWGVVEVALARRPVTEIVGNAPLAAACGIPTSHEEALRFDAAEAVEAVRGATTDAVAHLLSVPLPDLRQEAPATEAEHRATGRLAPRDAAVRDHDPGLLLLTESHRNDADHRGAHRSVVVAHLLGLDLFRRIAAHRPPSAVGILHLRVGVLAGVYRG